MVPLDRALVRAYRLSIVIMPLTEAACPQFAMQVFGNAVSQYSPRLREWGESCEGSELVP